MSYVNPFGPSSDYVNPFGPQSTEQVEQKSDQAKPAVPLRRNLSAFVLPSLPDDPSPHSDPKAKFKYLNRRFSLSTPPSSSSSSANKIEKGKFALKKSNEEDAACGIGRKISVSSGSETHSSSSINTIVTEFKDLWAIPTCRIQLQHLAEKYKSEENCLFLNSLKDYYKLFESKEIKKIIEKHDHIVDKYLKNNASHKIHAEMEHVEYRPIGEETFTLPQLEEKFKVVEGIVYRTIAQNFISDPEYALLRETYLVIARMRRETGI